MNGRAFDGVRSFQQGSSIKLSLGWVIVGGTSSSKASGGVFDDLVRNGAFDSPRPSRTMRETVSKRAGDREPCQLGDRLAFPQPLHPYSLSAYTTPACLPSVRRRISTTFVSHFGRAVDWQPSRLQRCQPWERSSWRGCYSSLQVPGSTFLMPYRSGL